MHANVFCQRCCLKLFLTGDFAALDVEARLILEAHPPIVGARVHVAHRVLADATPAGPLRVTEAHRAPQGALDGVLALPEHGVEGRVARDRVAQRLERLEVLLAVALFILKDVAVLLVDHEALVTRAEPRLAAEEKA